MSVFSLTRAFKICSGERDSPSGSTVTRPFISPASRRAARSTSIHLTRPTSGHPVSPDAHGPERSGAELADNPIAPPDAQPDRKVLTTLDGGDCRGVSVHHKSPETISPIKWASSDVNGTSLNRYRLSIHHDFGGHVKLCGHPTARERRRPGLVSRSEPFGPAEALPSTFFMVG